VHNNQREREGQSGSDYLSDLFALESEGGLLRFRLKVLP